MNMSQQSHLLAYPDISIRVPRFLARRSNTPEEACGGVAVLAKSQEDGEGGGRIERMETGQQRSGQESSAIKITE